ncbi:MAG: DUF1801 domain-containing protein [Bacteroidota bacterium]
MAKTSTNKKLAVLKTKENNASVEGFLKAITDETKRKDSEELVGMMKKITGEKPKMWGTSIIGFGNYIYESPKTGRSGEWFMTGFSPRKQNLTIYFMTGLSNFSELMKKLGKYKISGGSCLYISKLADVDVKILKELVSLSFSYMKKKHSKQ